MKKLIISVVVLVLTVCNTAMARDVLTDKEKALIMKVVKRELKDPESARFKWVKLSEDVDMKAHGASINYCGLVNSKNSYGGYVGDRPFRATLAWSKGKMSDQYLFVTLDESIDAALEICSKLGYVDFSKAD